MTLLALYSGNDFAVKMKDSRTTKVSQLQKIPETILIFIVLVFFIHLYQEFFYISNGNSGISEGDFPKKSMF